MVCRIYTQWDLQIIGTLSFLGDGMNVAMIRLDPPRIAALHTPMIQDIAKKYQVIFQAQLMQIDNGFGWGLKYFW